MDYGFYDRALFYMENIANVISQHSGKYDFGFVNNVLQIADRFLYLILYSVLFDYLLLIF